MKIEKRDGIRQVVYDAYDRIKGVFTRKKDDGQREYTIAIRTLDRTMRTPKELVESYRNDDKEVNEAIKIGLEAIEKEAYKFWKEERQMR